MTLNAQVQIKVMHYNLLYYGLNVYECTDLNNGINNKTQYLKTIINYVQPDILTVNEIKANDYTQNYLLNNVFYLNGFPQFKKGNSITGSFDANQIYYNSSKLFLEGQDVIAAPTHQFDLFKFYYRSPDLESGDTVRLICIIGHLKAGSYPENITERAEQANELMSYLNIYYEPSNILLMGDFNLYTSSEEAYQIFTNYSNTDIKFNDPVNAAGDWNSNPDFTDVHTQSTHYTSDCASGGGMDDRFDFILTSNFIIDGTENVEYSSGSYTTVGQDGNHLNDAINYGSNTSVPANVLDALYNNSDHLPVTLTLEINQTPANSIENFVHALDLSVQNPVSDFLNFTIYVNDVFNSNSFNVEIYSILGQKIYIDQIDKENNEIEYQIPVTDFEAGMYILRVYDENNNFYQSKFIKI